MYVNKTYLLYRITKTCLQFNRNVQISRFPFLGCQGQFLDTDNNAKVHDFTLRSLPSVTSILDKTKSPESASKLFNWIAKKKGELGEEGYSTMMKKMKSIGGQLHDIIWKFYKDDNKNPVFESADVEGFYVSVLPVLKSVDNVLHMEHMIYHPDVGYKGKFDCLAVIDKSIVLIEWKTAHERRIASMEGAYEAPVQLAAYAGAINNMLANHSSSELALGEAVINKPLVYGMLVYSYPDGTPAKTLPMNLDTLNVYWERWLDVMGKYAKHLNKQEQGAVLDRDFFKT